MAKGHTITINAAEIDCRADLIALLGCAELLWLINEDIENLAALDAAYQTTRQLEETLRQKERQYEDASKEKYQLLCELESEWASHDHDAEAHRLKIELEVKRDAFYRAAIEHRFCCFPDILNGIDSSQDILWRTIGQQALEDEFWDKTGLHLGGTPKQKRGRPKGRLACIALRSLVGMVRLRWLRLEKKLLALPADAQPFPVSLLDFYLQSGQLAHPIHKAQLYLSGKSNAEHLLDLLRPLPPMIGVLRELSDAHEDARLTNKPKISCPNIIEGLYQQYALDGDETTLQQKLARGGQKVRKVKPGMFSHLIPDELKWH